MKLLVTSVLITTFLAVGVWSTVSPKINVAQHVLILTAMLALGFGVQYLLV